MLDRVIDRMNSVRNIYSDCGMYPLITFLLSSVFIALQTRQMLLVTSVQKYTDVMVGVITRQNVSKSPDYYAPLIFWAAVALFVSIHYFLMKCFKTPQSTRETNRIFVYPLSLIVLVLGTQMVTRQTVSSLMVFAYLSPLISLAIICLQRCCLTAISIRSLNHKIWMIIILGFFTSLSLVTALGRANHGVLAMMQPYAKSLILGSYGAILIAGAAVLLVYRNVAAVSKMLDKYCALIQIPIPLLLLVLVPKPWSVGGKMIEGFRVSNNLHIALWIVIAFAFYKGIAFYSKVSNSKSGNQLLAPWAMVSILILLLMPAVESPILDADDYGVGETNLPWHQLLHFGKIPWIDLSPTYGFVHVFRGSIKWLFFNDTLMGYDPASLIMNSFFIGLLFFSALNIINVPAAMLVAMSLGPQTELVAPAMLFLLSKKLLNNYVSWAGAWILLVTLLLAFHLSSGLSFFLGTMPVLIWVLLKAYNKDKRSTIKLLAATAICFTVLFFITPLGEMLKGIVFFVRQHAVINTTAGAKIWGYADKNVLRDGIFGSNVLFEFMRFGWIMLLPVLGYFMISTVNVKSNVIRSRVYILSLFIIGYMLVNMKYSLGRIDASLTRTGVATTIVMMFCLPVVCFIRWGKSPNKYLLVPALLLLCSISLTLRKVPLPDPASLIAQTHEATVIEHPERLVDGQAIGIPAIGMAVMEDWHLDELMELKYLVQRYLKPGDIYLDLTNRASRYIYLNLPVPVFDANPYSTPSKQMQERVISVLKEKPQAFFIVIGLSRIDHDGTPMSLRNSLIYRFLAMNYVPFRDGNFVFMVHQSRVGNNNPMLWQERLQLLDMIFTPSELRGIPASWGNSWEHLAPLFTTMARLDNSDILSINSLAVDRTGSLSFTGTENASIVFSLHNKTISGRDAGYALVSYNCSNGSSQDNIIQVHWLEKNKPFNPNNSHTLFAPNGKMLIPLESSPYWLLSSGVESLIFSFPYSASCKSFTFKDVQLLKRNDVVN